MSNKLLNNILQSAPIQTIINTSKKISLPGFDGIPLYDVIIFFFQGIQKGALTTRAAALSFNFFLAIFPGIIFLFTLIPYFPIQDLEEQFMLILKEALPRNAFEATESTIQDILHRQSGGFLSFGFITAFYFATNAINSMISAFNSSYHNIESRSFFKQLFVSSMLVFILVFLLVIAVVLLVISGFVLDYLAEKNIIQGGFNIFLLQAADFIVLLALIFFGFSFLYYYGPSKKSKFRFISAGSTLATILSVITSVGFAYYVNNFGQYNKLYGSIGTLIVIMLWIYFNSIILLIGFELNASISNVRKEKLNINR